MGRDLQADLRGVTGTQQDNSGKPYGLKCTGRESVPETAQHSVVELGTLAPMPPAWEHRAFAHLDGSDHFPQNEMR